MNILKLQKNKMKPSIFSNKVVTITLAAVLGFFAVLTANIEGLDLIFGAGEWLIILAITISNYKRKGQKI